MLLTMAIDSSKLPRRSCASTFFNLRSESCALLVGVDMSKLSFALGGGDWAREGAPGVAGRLAS